MPDPLMTAAQAAKAKRRADGRYRAALVAAVSGLEESGGRNVYAQVARVVGVSRQAVRQLVEAERARRAAR